MAGLHPYRSRLSTAGGSLMSGLVQALSVLGLVLLGIEWLASEGRLW